MLELIKVRKSYEGQPLLSDISLTVKAHETICLLGPSGSGKSTLLRIIAGLEAPEDGQVLWDGTDLAATPPHLRDFGLVFQDYALFPHLDVFSNIAFGLKMRNWGDAKIKARLAEVLELVNLLGFEKRRVADLSGGEQQRVALARALAPHPRLLMFDEPLGALDRALRANLLNELRAILRRTGVPAIYVTHDQEEAFTIADRILILHTGAIVCEGSPAEVIAHPGSAWTANFLGLGNAIEGIVGEKQKIKSGAGVFTLRCAHRHQKGDRVSLLVRPHESPREKNTIRGKVMDVLFQQDGFKVTLDNGLYLYLKDASKVGKRVEARVKVECLEND
ncbi:MAG: hypothetical protein A2Z03_08095 [Chloroflexi bacterium RBG_16_56_8]|nr:MAG: hypothetical protein A2Z03_08095 [Chloroflexi bacterium RBG_16_56_8]